MFTKFQLRKAFSMHVCNARTRLGLSQSQVAERMAVTVRWVQRIESGVKLPSFYLAMQLIVFLQIDIHSLLKSLSRGAAQQDKTESVV